MKIYEIGTGYTPIPAQMGAATEIVVEELTRSFIKNGENAEIIDIQAEHRAETDLPIIEVKVPGIFRKTDVSLGIMHKLKRVAYSIALASKLKKLLKTEKEKVVLHFHNQYNLFFFFKLTPKKLRAKAVVAYTNHNGVWSLPWDEAEQILHKRYFQEIAAMKEADIVFVLNHDMKDNVVDHLGVPSERVIQINNGVNTDIYSPLSEDQIAEIKAKYNLNGKKVILHVGSVYENKGQDRSVKMLAPLLKQNKNLIFAYVGGIVSQEYYDEVQNIVKALDVEDQVVYLGAVSPGVEMNELYNMADVTIFLSKYEGFPLVCIESLSAGVPVILCSESLLNFGNGCIGCAPDSLETIVSEMVLDNSDKHFSLCESARKNAVENYSWSRIAQDYCDAFHL